MTQTRAIATPAPWNDVADAYTAEVALELAPYSADAIELLNPAPDAVVLDVACGPGTCTLQLAPRVARVDAVDFATEMVARLQKRLTTEGVDNVHARVMDGQALGFDDGQFDAAFCMFGLMFFADPRRGLSELVRVLAPGGRAVVATWAHPERSPMMQQIVGALTAALPGLSPPPPAVPLDTAAHVGAALTAAGLVDVEVRAIRHGRDVRSAETLWRYFEQGGAPIKLLRASMGAASWQGVEAVVLATLRSTLPPLPAVLESEALVGIGRRP